MARPPIKRISRGELRRIFNRLYLADVEAGRLTEVVESEGPPNPRMNQPPGARSQRVRYLNASGRSVAVVHRYLLPDGTLGGSGLPDPKAVFKDGVLYAAPTAGEPPRPPKGKARRKNPRKQEVGSPAMAVRKLRAMPAIEVPPSDASIIAPTEPGFPAFRSDGPENLVCGQCEAVLIEGANPGQFVDLFIRCAGCGATNDVNP